MWRVGVCVPECRCVEVVSLYRANVHVCGVACCDCVCLVYSSYIWRFSSFKTPWFFSGTSWAQREGDGAHNI